MTQSKVLDFLWGSKFKYYVLSGILGALVVALLFKQCSPTPPVPKLVTPKEQVKQVEKNEVVAKVKFDSLNSEYLKLKEKANKTQQNLNALQNYARVIEQELSYSSGDVRDAENNEYTDNDSAHTQLINDLIANSKKRDTICNETIRYTTEQVVNRNQVISQKDSLYSQLRGSFNLAVAQQVVLLDNQKKLKKDLRKKKFGNWIWKAATLTLAGVLIKNQIK